MNKKIITEPATYTVDNTVMEGLFCYEEETSERKPAIIVAHAWKGRDQFVLDRAKQMAQWGYVGFAADVYGKDKLAVDNDEALQLMLPLFTNRQLLQSRINAAYEIVEKHPRVDPGRIAAIGFCFGGLTVLELMRSGAKVQGIVSFHGVLADALGEAEAVKPKNSDTYYGKALFCHGNDDPLVSDKDIKKVIHELDEKRVDWQFHTYGGTMHAFTNPDASAPSDGLLYNPIAKKRSFQTLENFITEIFT